jgi:cell fate regulator YaaT (PSP1 superfamily)
MAREQQLTLNPTKISGACGRLMCCLSYELALYRQSASQMPPVGAHLRTGRGPCLVIRTELHRQVVWLRDAEGHEHRVALDELPPGPWPRGPGPLPAEEAPEGTEDTPSN